MSAPVLTISEQKSSLSGKLKKKKTVKNILNIPNNLQVQYEVLEIDKAKKLCSILERLLPSAKLPSLKTNDTKETKAQKSVDESELKLEALNKRNQLSLGINELGRCIKKEIISAVLFSSDIQPKFLIHHLNLLCNHHKIPHLHIPGLRQVMKTSLGFSCIVVGFKKNSSDFAEAVNEIKDLYLAKANIYESKDKLSSSESEEEEVTKEKKSENITETFEYLYRDSLNERKFLPEASCLTTVQINKQTESFISVNKDDDDELNNKEKTIQLGISERFMKQKQKVKKREEFTEDFNEDLNIPKKKNKKPLVIDTGGTKQKNKYYPANIVKVSSNPNRTKKSK